MVIEGKRVKMKPLTLEDVFEMRNWGFHQNPLLSDYNFPQMTDYEVEKWYRLKTGYIRDKYFSIRDENHKLIGYMGIKKIRFFKKESTLGIVFDPNKINQGYGTEALAVFLDYYFLY